MCSSISLYMYMLCMIIIILIILQSSQNIKSYNIRVGGIEYYITSMIIHSYTVIITNDAYH